MLRRFLQHTQWVVGHIQLPLTPRGTPLYIYIVCYLRTSLHCSLLTSDLASRSSSSSSSSIDRPLSMLTVLGDPVQWHNNVKKKPKKDQPHQHSLFVCDCLTLTLVRVVRQPSVSFYHAKQTCGCKGCGIENEVSTLASSFHRLLFNVSE